MKTRESVLGYIEHLRHINAGVKENTHTYSTNGRISEGCRSCKSGRWMCVFLGQICNLKCPWCPNPEPDSNKIQVHGGIWDNNANHSKADVIRAAKDKLINGVSYSGGEPLLRFNDLLELVDGIKKQRDDVYQWVYTNGVLLDKGKIESLARAGINEIRIDLAATNYSDDVINKIEWVSRWVTCTVEVPVIDSQLANLLGNLQKFVNIGLTYLNLHDLYISNKFNNYVKSFDLNNNYYDPVTANQRYLPSIEWVHSVFHVAKEIAPELSINECLITNAAHQWVAFQWQSQRLSNKTIESLDEFICNRLHHYRSIGLTL